MVYKIIKLVLFSTPAIVMLLLIGIINGQSHKANAEEMTQKEQPIDENLINKKPTERRRLNENGYSQRYIELSWTNRDERAIQLLQAYGFNWEQERNSIKTIARIHRIFPQTFLCIMYADSSMGKFLKTERNYGNVGNVDSWKTRTFDNFEQWVDAIGRYALNWKYLKDKKTIWELSPYGWATWAVYATSPSSWWINILNCLWMIHNKQINNDWAFRF